MQTSVGQHAVLLHPLEKDDRVDEIARLFPKALKLERAYGGLSDPMKKNVDAVLDTLRGMRFENRTAFENVAESLLTGIAPELERYIAIALENAQAQCLSENKGVLVIYTGGTIGSAPKDPDDPDSPQVVRPWRELKNAAPRLGLLGYSVDAVSFVEPLDSCNVGPSHWRAIVDVIQKYYEDYEGFVILHGTDSMVYTAAALSFMLLDLTKPVVVTGSQIAGIVNARNDAHQNIITAIQLANPLVHKLPMIPEVMISFANRILRGNRTKKMNVVEFQGFDSPNCAHLGSAGDTIHIERKHLRTPTGTGLNVMPEMDTNVIVVEVFPGMQHSQILENILKDPHLKGVVLKSYGAGNIPTDPPFLNLFRDFIQKGGIVVNTTSCPAGEVVMGLYETSQVLLDRGIIGGFDITPEAALCKLMMLLGNFPDGIHQVKSLMQQSLAGEQRLNLLQTCFEKKGVAKGGEPCHLPPIKLNSHREADRIDKVMLRFLNAVIDVGQKEQVAISLYLDGMGTSRDQKEHFLATFKRRRVPEHALVVDDSTGESVSFDLTPFKERFVLKSPVSSAPIQKVQTIHFTVVMEDGGNASFAWESAELNIYVSDS